MFRLLWAALRSRRGETLALIVLTVLASAAATATPLYLESAERTAIETELEMATANERSVTVSMTTPDANIATAAESMRSKLQAVISWPALTVATGGWVSGTFVKADSKVDAVLAAREGVCDHLKLQGTCPVSTGDVVISQTLAKELNLKPGDTFTYLAFGGGAESPLKVTGVYDEVAAVSESFWAGRSALTPYPNRSANPVFTPAATIVQSGVGSATANADLIAGPGALSKGDLSELASQLRQRVPYGFTPDEARGLRYLLDRVTTTRRALGSSLPAGAVQLLLLCWLVLLLTITYGALQRRGESGVTLLRGAPFRVRLATTFAPPAVILLLFSPFGFVLGLLAAQAMPTAGAGIAAGVTVLVILTTAVIAISRVNAVPLHEALRNVPSRRGGRATLIAEAVAVAVAALAVVQAVSSGPESGIGMLAPVAVALVAGLAAARLVRGIAAGAGAAALRRGRLSLGLATIQLSRRPGADRLVTLIVVAVAMALQAAAAWDVAAKQALTQAETELGAASVMTVARTPRTHLLHAVRTADPEGKWAMAVARENTDEVALVAADATRLAAVTGHADLAGYAGRLRPQGAEQIRVTGSEAVFDFRGEANFVATVEVTVVLEGPDGLPVSGSFTLKPEQTQGKIATPACTAKQGCRLAWLKFAFSPAGLSLIRISQLSPDRTLLAGPEIAAPGRWRTEFNYDRAAHLLMGEDSAMVFYAPRRPGDNPAVRLVVAGNPVPVPALVSGPPDLLYTRELASHPLFGGAERPLDLVAAMPVLPGLPVNGVLTDLEIADLLDDSFDNSALLQVWLGPAAPSDAEARLRAAGLTPIKTETVASRAAQIGVYGAGPGARLRLIAAVIGLLLLLPAMAVVASADRRARAVELKALRLQGVPQSIVDRATGGYGLLVAAAMPVALLTALLTWQVSPTVGHPPDPLVLLAVFTGSAVLLAIAARFAKRALACAVAGGAA